MHGNASHFADNLLFLLLIVQAHNKENMPDDLL